LNGAGLDDLTDDVVCMIEDHHKLRPVRAPGRELIEIFRKADLIDFSLGLVKFRLSASQVAAIKSEFPNLGFHKGLALTAGRWICRHPLNPLPVVRW
jgi:hypothetical protein